MQVTWLRFPLTVKWYITGVCNLRCTHCYLTDYTKEARLSRVLEVVDYLAEKGVCNIALLGGEPLARKDIAPIVSAITQHGIAPNIATNGTLATPLLATELVSAGARHFQVSLEGHSPELSDPIRGRDTFDKILQGASNLKNAGARVTLSLVLSHENAKHVTQMHALARDTGADVLRLAVFVPIGTGRRLGRDYMLDANDIASVKHQVSNLRARFPEFPIDCELLPTRDSPCDGCTKTFGCGAGTTTMMINNDLSLSACDLLTEEDRTAPISRPSDIETFWLMHPIFKKWRGEVAGRTASVGSFENVHGNGCHVAFSTYGRNIFAKA